MSWPSPFKSIECTQQQQQQQKLKNEAQDLSRHLCREDIQMANRHTKRCSSLILSREMQIKLQWDILVRMATVKEASNKCWRGCGEKGSPYPPHTLLVECKLVQPLWGTEWRCLKKLKTTAAMWSSSATSGYIFKGNENRKLKRDLHSHVHWSIIHNSQDAETT